MACCLSGNRSPKPYRLSRSIIAVRSPCSLIVLAVGWLTAPAMALEASDIQARLCGSFEGTFRWDAAPIAQVVSIRLEPVTIDGAGAVWAVGKGDYIIGGVKTTSIDVTWVIEAQSLRFEMWEHNPVGGSTSFVTDGSHVGTIASDLRTIEATWTTKGSGRRGQLRLAASCLPTS